MRSLDEVSAVLTLVKRGLNDCEISRELGIPRRTINQWRHGRTPGKLPRRAADGGPLAPCPICSLNTSDLPESEYAFVFGLYLGDGCISKGPRTFAIRLALDARYPGVVAACARSLEAIRPEKRAWCGRRRNSRCIDVVMCWNHWPCLFPQHGPGRKHLRPIVLAPWQEEIVTRERKAFIRGLIHSDGCRIVANDRGVASVRYHFSNLSEDIKRIYCESLDAVGVRWTRPCSQQIAVYRKASVAILDSFVGPKR